MYFLLWVLILKKDNIAMLYKRKCPSESFGRLIKIHISELHFIVSHSIG